MDWGTALWDQHDAIDKHTQLGCDLIDRYVKFVKEKVELEQNYSKQLKALCKKHSRRGNKEDQEMKFSNPQMFQELLCELSECASLRESMAENMIHNICVELNKYLHDHKLERKSHLNEVKKLQQNLETSYKQLEASKKRFEKEWKEAEKANQQAEKTDQDPASNKADVEKARINARQHMDQSDECKNDYAVQLQKYNKEQNQVYYTDIPSVINKLQQMEEKRIRKLAEGYSLLADTERKTLPAISQSLEKIITHSSSINEKQDSMIVIEQFKSGQAPPSDVEFEDYSQAIRPAVVENTHHTPKVRIKQLFKKNKQGGIIDRNMGPHTVEDFSHLSSDQRKKRLQEKIDELNKELQKETDRSEGLYKMKRVYEQNKQLGDPTSLEPQINQTTQNISRIKGDLSRYQALLGDVGVSMQDNSQTSLFDLYIPPLAPSVPNQTDIQVQSSFYEDFDDVPIAQCLALYDFKGVREGEVSMEAGERLSVLDEDLGDGWVRVRRLTGSIGYVPASYIKII